ncbi:Subunit 17 of Mediator complex, partial [Teratosphaeria destructans]
MASLTLPLWGPKSNDQPKLHDVLGRVAHERGHFRDITEASLQEEIATEGAIPLSSTDDDESEDDDDDDDEHEATGPSTLEEVIKMRQEMHALVSTTLSTDVSLLLDTVSLALSRYKPDAAKTTLSAVLQQQGIPLGSLGTDVWHRMPEDTAREEEDERIATHVRLEGLRESANALLAAATRLNENVRKETQYWERVLSISEKGWNVCRIPGPQRLLGVTFGFSESAPEFSRRGIAALTTTEEGDLTLGRGFGRKAKALRVVIKRHGQVVGVSRTPETSTDEEGQLTLDQRIRRARDSLFDEELYHEMIREARTVANFGVHTTRDGILFTPDPTPSDDDSNLETLFQLLPLPDHDAPPSPPPPETPLAQTLALAARLHHLLTTANLHPTALHPARLTSPPKQNISTAAALTDALLDPWRSTAV